MTSEQIIQSIEKAQRELPWNGRPTQFQNNIASVSIEGESIARGWGFEWIDGEGYPQGYWDAVIKGMKHNLKVSGYPKDVHEFYAKFF
jgi:hypothetical protein